jgi:hypothetical protein
MDKIKYNRVEIYRSENQQFRMERIASEHCSHIEHE